MPVTLLSASTHTLYAKRSGAPLYHKEGDKKGGNFTLHHVIPYRYPFFVGFLFEQLIRTYPAWSTERGGGGKELARRMVEVYNQLVPHPAVTRDSLFRLAGTADGGANLRVGHHFAWLGVNLFVGPSGTWRLDDPHEGAEANKPRSFDPRRWDTLFALKATLDTYAPVFDDTAKTAETFQIDLDGYGLIPRLLAHLEALAPHGKDAHPYHPSDWVVLDSDFTPWVMAQRSLSRFLGGPHLGEDATTILDAKELMKTILNEDKTRRPAEQRVTELAPVAHRRVTFAGAATPDHWGVMWRLRLDGEAVPEAKFKANVQLQ